MNRIITSKSYSALLPSLRAVASACAPTLADRLATCERFEVEDTVLRALGYAWDIGAEAAAPLHAEIARLTAEKEAADADAAAQAEADQIAAAAAYIPKAISNADLRRGLVELGIKPQLVTDYITAMPDGPQKWAAWTDWEYANYMLRAHPLLDQLAPAFGMTSADVDALFKSKPEYPT